MKTHVNLLPLKYRRVVLLRSLLLRWCAVWFAAIVLMGSVIWGNASRRTTAERTVSVKESLCKPVLATAQANNRMRARVRRFEHCETLVGQLRDDKPTLNMLAAVSNSARECGGRITVRDLLFQQSAVTPAGDRNRAPVALDRPEAVLTIEGEALDNLAIAKFAAGLRDAALFRDVELKSSIEKTSRELQVHSFIVRCEI